jgi:hypothetical protein
MTGFSFIEPSDSIPKKPLFVVIGGYPGLGKTSISFTVNNVLHIDVDKGIERAIQKKRPLSVRITKYGDFKAYVMSKPFEDYVLQREIKAVAIDTVGALLEDSISPYLMSADSKNARAGGLSLQGWGSLQNEFNQLLERFFSLNLTVVGVCHAKEEGDDGPKQLRLAVKGGSNEIIMRKADLLGFVSMRQKQRTLDFEPTDYQVGKNTAQLPALTIPSAITPEYDFFLQEVIDKTYEKMAELSDAQSKAIADLQEYSDKVDACKSLDELEALNNSEPLKKLSKAISMQIKKLISSRYAFLYTEMHLADKKTDSAFNEVVSKVSEVSADFRLPIFEAMKSKAAEVGLVYDGKVKKFIQKPQA